jgi:SSS family solute:Na+ symporter
VCTMIIAATMSTMMMANGTILKNIYADQINPKATDKQLLNVSRYGTMLFALSSLIVVFFIPSAALTKVFLTIIHIATGPVSFSILAGILWKRTTRQASLWSMIVGVVVGVVWLATGLNATIEPIYPVIVASFGVGIIVTLATSKPGDDNRHEDMRKPKKVEEAKVEA